MKFGAQAEAFSKFVRSARKHFRGPLRNERPVAFLVLPWMQTPVPWFSLALALMYRARGCPVEVIFADLPAPNPAESEGQLPSIERVLGELREKVPIHRLSEQPAVELTAKDEAEVKRLAELNVVYLRRTGATGAAAAENFASRLTESLRHLHHLFADGRYDHWVVPGGIYGVSGLCVYQGKLHGVRVATYDSGPGTNCIATDGVAAHCLDTAKLFNPEYEEFVHAHREQAVTMAKNEFEARRAARDRYNYSTTAYSSEKIEGCDVLFPLNIFDDAAGLGGHRFFSSPQEWLCETIGLVLRHTPLSIIVREHPGARHVPWQDDIGDRIQAAFPGEPRLRFIFCREQVSTYQLLESAKIVLPYSSTVGVEAAMLGKQVVIEAVTYYAKLGFVQEASSREDYFARILATLAAGEPLPQSQVDKAWQCYFYGQVASYVDCDFTPAPPDFEKWVRRSFHTLAQEVPVKHVVDVFLTNTPSWRLQGERLFHPAPAPAPRKRSLLSLLGLDAAK